MASGPAGSGAPPGGSASATRHPRDRQFGRGRGDGAGRASGGPFPPGRRGWIAAALAFALVEPSLPVTHHYAGTGGVAVLVAAAVAGVIALPALARWAQARLSPRQAHGLAAATLLLVAVMAVVVYPLANAHTPGAGSDRDDALVLGATALLHGDYPYHAATYLGNPITPLPGALLLAIPFVLLGAIALQNVVWLAVFYAAAGAVTGDWRRALLLLWVTLATPAVAHEAAVGGDLFANGVYAAAFLLLLARRAARPRGGAVAAALFGVAMASRVIYPFLFPLAFARVAAAGGRHVAARRMAVAAAVFALLTVPFYLYDPEHFSPLHVSHKLVALDGALPQASVLVPTLTAVVACVACLAVRVDDARLLVRAAGVTAVPTLAAALAALGTNRAAEHLGNGVSFTAMAVLGLGALLLAPARPTGAVGAGQPTTA